MEQLVCCVCKMCLLTARAHGKILLAAAVRGHSRAVSSSCVVLLASSPSEQLQSKEVEGHAHSSLPRVPPLLVPTSAEKSGGQVASDGSSESRHRVATLSHDTPSQTQDVTSNHSQPPEQEWREMRVSLRQLPKIYLKLSKHRLTSLVVLTALLGYSMAPAPVEWTTLTWAMLGTTLCSAAANTGNQWLEVPFDSQMARTKSRVLVRSLISPLHAFCFGLGTGIAGVGILATQVNPLTAVLGLSNIVLYTAVYTPLKRISIINTWVGSVVGAIPPIMGWTACTGYLSPEALILGAILYSWQFPHFNALSWSLQADYSRGGFRMMSVTDPDLCHRVALRHSLAMIPICTLAPITGLSSWWFALDSLPLNLWFALLGWRFYHNADFQSARKLFRFSLFHLPLLLGLLLINKKWTSDSNKLVPKDGERTAMVSQVAHTSIDQLQPDSL